MSRMNSQSNPTSVVPTPTSQTTPSVPTIPTINHEQRLPVLTCAEDVIRLQDFLGLSDQEVEVLALELELAQLPPNAETPPLYSDTINAMATQETVTNALNFEKVHRDFITPMRLSSGATTFFDVSIEDLYFLKNLEESMNEKIKPNAKCLRTADTGLEAERPPTLAKGSAKAMSATKRMQSAEKTSSVTSGQASEADSGIRGWRGLIASSAGQSHPWELWAKSKTLFPREGGIIKWPKLINEYTLIVDALERVMQDSSQGAACHLSLRQMLKICEYILDLDNDLVKSIAGPIYEHWRRRRNSTSTRCLVREFVSPHHPSLDQGTFSAFKPRNRERFNVGVRRQRRPNRENHKKLYRLAHDFVDVVGLMSLIVHLDCGKVTERRLRKLRFLERRREIMDPNYQSPFEHRKMTVAVASTMDESSRNIVKPSFGSTLKTTRRAPILEQIAQNGISLALAKPRRSILSYFSILPTRERRSSRLSIGLDSGLSLAPSLPNPVGTEPSTDTLDTLTTPCPSNLLLEGSSRMDGLLTDSISETRIIQRKKGLLEAIFEAPVTQGPRLEGEVTGTKDP